MILIITRFPGSGRYFVGYNVSVFSDYDASNNTVMKPLSFCNQVPLSNGKW